jgi:4'-phosphopantetheinyl transferase EntD
MRQGPLMGRLLPNQARCHECPPEPVRPRLHLLEEEHILNSRMSDNRRRDFTLGRWCAREVLLQFGYKDWPLLPAPSRAPIWPEGLVGSITHCKDFCAAAVGSTTDFDTIGIDAEVWQAFPLDIRQYIVAKDEYSTSGIDLQCGRNLALVFSAKESIFKALNPLTQAFFDFTSVSLHFNEVAGTFCISDTTVPALMPYLSRTEGKFAYSSFLVITSSFVRVNA